jgi:hypothetical protein
MAELLELARPLVGRRTRFHADETRRQFGRNRYNTMVGLTFCIGTLMAILTTLIWLPTIQTVMLEKDGITGAAAIPYVSHGMMLWGIGGIFGYACFGFIADAIGRRPVIILYNVGTMVLGFTIYLGLSHYNLYPYVRATALSFCNGTGRIITSTGPLIAGLTTAAAIMTGFAGLSILAMVLGRETREDPLPLFEVSATGARSVATIRQVTNHETLPS